MSFSAPWCAVVGRLQVYKVGAVVWKDAHSDLLLEEVCVSEDEVSAPSELLLRVIVVSVGYYPHF